MTEEAQHVPDGYSGGKGKGGNVRKHQWSLCYRQEVNVHMTSFGYRASGVTEFKTTKINYEDPRQLFTKICIPENYPLYGTSLRYHTDDTDQILQYKYSSD